MTTASEDDYLVARAKMGDVDAFEQLVIRYQRLIYGVALRVVHQRADALDVTQDAFIKAFRSINDFRGESKFYTWLYRIALNAAFSCLEKTKRSQSVEERNQHEVEGMASIERGPDDPSSVRLENQQALAAVDIVLESMPEPFATALLLHACEGRTCAEIACLTAVRPGTVRTRIHRARQLINESIDQAPVPRYVVRGK